MTVEIALGITLGFIGGFTFAILLLMSIVKKAVTVSRKIEKSKKGDE